MNLDRIQVIFQFHDPALNDEERLQAEVERLLPQLREVEGVEDVGLVTEAVPRDGKAFGGIVKGAVQFAVDNSNILKGLWWVGDRLVNKKTLELMMKAPDGREFTGKASSRTDMEFLLQQAEEFYRSRS